LKLDERLYLLRRSGESLKLEPKVLDVLVHLLRSRDRVVTKDEFDRTRVAGAGD